MVAIRTSPAGFPMAPSAEEWAALSSAEREAVVAALPGEVTYDEMAMPEGDEDRLRFYAGTELLLESEDLIAQMYDAAQRRAEEAERLREEETRRREAAEQEVAR